MFDFCSTIPFLAIDPSIDGALEPGLIPIDISPIWALTPALTGVSARYAIAWRPDRLYLFVDVAESSRWPAPAGLDVYCGDAVELYVDSSGMYPAAPLYNDPGTRQFMVAAPSTDTAAVAHGEVYKGSPFPAIGTWTSTGFGAFPRPGGYTVEAVVDSADLGLGAWSVSGQVGFDIAVDIATSDGSLGDGSCGGASLRLSQFDLHIAAPTASCNGFPFCDPRAFCTPTVTQ
jgi:hypothetical protein